MIMVCGRHFSTKPKSINSHQSLSGTKYLRVATKILVVLLIFASLSSCIDLLHPYSREYCEFIVGWSDKYRNYSKDVYKGYCYATREQCELSVAEEMETMYAAGCQTVPVDKPWKHRLFKFSDTNVSPTFAAQPLIYQYSAAALF
jgi:hypothetical protein